MIRSLRTSLIASLALLAGTVAAWAHPHVWVTVKCEIVWAPDGRIAAVKHHWTFDEGYTSYAIQGLDTNRDGIYSRDELAELAKVNTESLAETGFFTVVKADGKKQEFGAPADYWLEHEKGQLTLNFTLPLKEPATARRTLILDVYDPTFFVDFSYADGDDAVKLTGSPQNCAVQLSRPKKPDAKQVLTEDYFANANMGFQFASKVIVACP
ncbi:DUF1007 domain-containing protein [Alsobacter soli]|uniref:DUF1007 domain-containing protein n=1 Tax=Alsobacter soli TaxID=2109933 RepID=A0A2T1HZL5_9HYPH|nr:DUF1007 family protein [Alsobacter soli]PSC07075.1 DUF1007 domain-containing protein [Alsobacter soli]